MAANYAVRALRVEGNSMHTRKVLVAYGLVLVMAIGLAAPFAVSSARAAPDAIPCPKGTTTFSGTVKDQEGNALAGVVVVLATMPNLYPQYGGMANSSSSGYWALTFYYQCPMNAKFYWWSASQGPLLLTVTNIPKSTTYNVHIWRQAINAYLLYEYPDTTNATVSFTETTNFQFDVKATVSGSINAGFIVGVNAEGSIGTTLTMETTSSFSKDLPYGLFYPTGMAWKAEDVNGNYVVWVQQFQTSYVSSALATEYMSESTGINLAVNDGQNPYITVSPGGPSTYTRTFSATVTLDGSVSVTVFGVTLTMDVSTSSGTTQSFSIQLTNNGSSDACYAIYQEGPEFHVWYYGPGFCP